MKIHSINLALLNLVIIIVGFTSDLFSQNKITPIEICRTKTYSESPIFDKEGNIYVSESYRGPVIKITPEGDTTTWTVLEEPNGHEILPDGNHLICDMRMQAIVKLDATGQVIEDEICKTCGDYPIGIPNDIVLDNRGGYYFTDCGQIVNGKRKFGDGKICYVDSTGKSYFLAGLKGMPNGITINADYTAIYIAQSMKNRILSFKINSTGDVDFPEVFAKVPVLEDESWSGPDGIEINKNNGKLYVTQYGAGKVYEFNSNGHFIRSIPTGQKNCSNIAFSKEDENIIFVTGSPGKLQEGGILYKIKIN
jgi:gluconolactonase